MSIGQRRGLRRGEKRGRRLVLESLEARRLLASGEIHGSVWSDLNANGVWDDGESGQAGVTVYLDTNGNGQLDVDQNEQPLEPVAVTASDSLATVGVDETGSYEFTGLDAGAYTVAEVLPEGNDGTSPKGTGSLGFVRTLQQEYDPGRFGSAIAMSPNGLFMYTTSYLKVGRLNVFRRDPESSELTLVQVIKDGEEEGPALRAAESTMVAPDGRHLYVGSLLSHALSVYQCDTETGELTLVQVLEDDSLEGIDGLGYVSSVVSSPDGRHVYTASADDGIAVFRRNLVTGELTFVRVLKDGVDGLETIGGASSVAVSHDGAYVYVTASRDNAVNVFQRDAVSGDLALVQSLTDRFGWEIPALPGAQSVVVDRHGFAYVAGEFNTGVAMFHRDTASGELTHINTVGKDSYGLDLRHMPLILGPDGRIYAAASLSVGTDDTDAVVVLRRNDVTTQLEVVEVVEIPSRQDSQALSPEGNSFYMSVENIMQLFEPAYLFAEPGRYTIDLPSDQVVAEVDFGNHTNAAPELALPGSQTTELNTTMVFSSVDGNAVSIADQDAFDAPVELTVEADQGSISLARTNGLAFKAGDGVDDEIVTIVATVDAINDALDGMRFTPAADFLGQTGIQIAVSDLGYSRPGGVKNDAGTVTITVDGSGTVNDPPEIVVPAFQNVEGDTELIFATLLGNAISISDPDAGWMPVGVALSSTHGTMTLSTVSGLTVVTGDGVEDPAMSFSGAIPDINTALDGMKFSPTAGYTGSARIEISVDDKGHTGPGEAQTAQDQVVIAVTSGGSEIRGTKWSDLNANGVWDDGEPGLAGVTIYLDVNGNGQLDLDQELEPLEPITVTSADDPSTPDFDETGTYQFAGLSSGTYKVAEILPEAYEPTWPVGTEPLTSVVVGGELPSTGISDTMNSIATSPDGRHVYTTSFSDDSVHLFQRNVVTGDLTYTGRIADGWGGSDGLDGAQAVEVSPDGRHVYVAGYHDDALAVFQRNSATGELTFAHVFKDGQDGVDGLDGVRSIVISPDGRHLYAAAYEDNAISVFERDGLTGALTFVELTSGFEQATCVATSPDGAQVYAVGVVGGWGGVTVFRRDAATGHLTSRQRVSVDFSSSIINAESIVIAPDGQNAYVAVGTDLFVFGRDLVTGELSDRGKRRSDHVINSVAVNPDGRHVYVTYVDDTSAEMSLYRRDATGRLTLADIIQDSGTHSAAATHSLTVSPDGSHVYAGLYRSSVPQERLLALEQHQHYSRSGSHEITLGASQLVEDVSFGNHTNTPAQITAPSSQTAYRNVRIVFAETNGNGVSVTDPDTPFGSVEVTLSVDHGTISLTDVGGLAFSEGDGTEDRSMTFIGPITNVNAALEGMQYVPPAGAQVEDEIRITTGDLGDARPGGERTDTDVISIAVGEAVSTELGEVDFVELDGLDPSLGMLSYVVQPTHSGVLTVEASVEGDPNSIQLNLYDADPLDDDTLVPLATSVLVDGKQRIDYEMGSGAVKGAATGLGVVSAAAEASPSYYVALTGTGVDVDLRVVDLVEHEGTTVTVHGTDGDDRFEFSAATSRAITINGVEYAFESSEARTVLFDGGAGRDVVVLADSPGDETFAAEASHAVLTNADSTTGFSVEVDGFEELHAYARSGGSDSAQLYDSEKKDKFKAEPAEKYAKMYGGQMYNRVKFFDVVEAFSSGQDDLARVFDTPADDTFVGQKDVCWLTTEDPDVLDVGMHGFGQVIAFAYENGNDVATLKDSELKDEYHGKSHKSQIFDAETDGDVYEITVRRFDTVRADGSDGEQRDVAKLWETVGSDRVEGASDWAKLSNEETSRLLYEVLAFEFVKVRSSTGGDDRSEVTEPLAYELVFGDGWEE